MEEKTPEQLKAIEELRKPVYFPTWVIFVFIVLVFLVFWYLSRDNSSAQPGTQVLKDSTAMVHWVLSGRV